MVGVVFDQVMRAIVHFSGVVQFQQARTIDWDDIEIKGVIFYDIQGDFMRLDGVILLHGVTGLNAQQIDVFVADQVCKYVFGPDFLIKRYTSYVSYFLMMLNFLTG